MVQFFIFYYEGVQAIDNKTVAEGGNVTLTCQRFGGSFQRLTSMVNLEIKMYWSL